MFVITSKEETPLVNESDPICCEVQEPFMAMMTLAATVWHRGDRRNGIRLTECMSTTDNSTVTTQVTVNSGNSSHADSTRLIST